MKGINILLLAVSSLFATVALGQIPGTTPDNYASPNNYTTTPNNYGNPNYTTTPSSPSDINMYPGAGEDNRINDPAYNGTNPSMPDYNTNTDLNKDVEKEDQANTMDPKNDLNTNQDIYTDNRLEANPVQPSNPANPANPGYDDNNNVDQNQYIQNQNGYLNPNQGIGNGASSRQLVDPNTGNSY